MSDRVVKKAKKSSSERRNALLLSILSSSIEMPSCSNCEQRGIESCRVSDRDSSRCSECVRAGRSRCDVQGPSNDDLVRIGTQFRELEEAVERAEEERRAADAKVERLRKQKKLWFEKMMRAVRRGISSVEELERVEKEEAEREAVHAAENRPPSSDSNHLDEAFIDDWNSLYPGVVLDPSIMVDFGLVDGTRQVTVGSSPG
jgi:hypothetical protein